MNKKITIVISIAFVLFGALIGFIIGNYQSEKLPESIEAPESSYNTSVTSSNTTNLSGNVVTNASGNAMTTKHQDVNVNINNAEPKTKESTTKKGTKKCPKCGAEYIPSGKPLSSDINSSDCPKATICFVNLKDQEIGKIEKETISYALKVMQQAPEDFKPLADGWVQDPHDSSVTIPTFLYYVSCIGEKDKDEMLKLYIEKNKKDIDKFVKQYKDKDKCFTTFSYSSEKHIRTLHFYHKD